MNRREALARIGGLAAALSVTTIARAQDAHHPVPAVPTEPPELDQAAIHLLDEIEERAAHYFWERADKSTGLNYDRASASGVGVPAIGIGHLYPKAASIATSGFGLSALCVAAERGYLPAQDAEARMLAILDFFANRCPHVHGFFYHYIDVTNGARIAKYELSSIDTALLVCGVLHARRFLNSSKADALASTIYGRVDWKWMLNGGATLAMGWMPESGFIPYRWETFCEATLMYLIAIGSPTHPIPARSWDAIKRNFLDYGGIRFITSYGALFIHQYPHIWCDFRGVHDRYTNYFENSVAATRAHKIFCMQMHGECPWIDKSVWGFGASDNRHGGYTAWAGPPSMNHPDGTLAPHATGGSLPFLAPECVAVLKAMREEYPKTWGRYGFADAFNPGYRWYDPDVIGIDLGLVMLMAENLRSGSVWRHFMKNGEIRRAMQAVGFRPEAKRG